MRNIYEKSFHTLLELDKQHKNGFYPSLCIGENVEYSQGEKIYVHSPIDSELVAEFRASEPEYLDRAVGVMKESFKVWREIPAPKRGELVRLIGNQVREHKEALAYIITLETGKIYQEALGEVQEWIDICDYAVGLSRQLFGLTMSSERPSHRMMEQWHPLGVVGVISAFNFPMAVWAWNAMIALVCGNTIVWKPSTRTLLSSIAVHDMVIKALKQMPELPSDIVSLIIGKNDLGLAMAENKDINLLSATGSVKMGKTLAPLVASRLGKSLFELGGNSAMILTPSANFDMAMEAILFSALGTSGQRCTTLRRLIVHKDIEKLVLSTLIQKYKQVDIGDPLDENVFMGPIINEKAYMNMQKALELIKEQGGEVIYGGERIVFKGFEHGYYVRPALVLVDSMIPIMMQETFAPILYISSYSSIDEAITYQNSVPQGLSSSIFTADINEAERFLSAMGSDCGIANVNIGTSGAEIGGAFGGEKDTGGGRESGSDAWKAYMRRSTNTINYGDKMPLSQGIKLPRGKE